MFNNHIHIDWELVETENKGKVLQSESLERKSMSQK